jgi:hypothetical protein
MPCPDPYAAHEPVCVPVLSAGLAVVVPAAIPGASVASATTLLTDEPDSALAVLAVLTVAVRQSILSRSV